MRKAIQFLGQSNRQVPKQLHRVNESSNSEYRRQAIRLAPTRFSAWNADSCCHPASKGRSVTKLLKHSVLGLALALGSSSYAHAETVALAHGGFTGFVDDILNWLFGSSSSHSQSKGATPNTNVAPEVDPNLAVCGFALLAGTLTVMRAKGVKRP
jgi:hypothetical protein